MFIALEFREPHYMVRILEQRYAWGGSLPLLIRNIHGFGA